MKDALLNLLQALLSVAVIFITPFVIDVLRAIKAKAVSTIGVNAYNFARTFVEDFVKSHPDLFSEDEIVSIVDVIDNRFGDHLTRDEIRRMVDAVLKDLGKETTVEPVVEEKVSVAEPKVEAPVIVGGTISPEVMQTINEFHEG